MIIVSKDQFDKLIEEVIAEEIDEIKVPDGQYIWDNIKKNLDVSVENKIKKHNYKKVSGLIIAFVTISALLIWSPTDKDFENDIGNYRRENRDKHRFCKQY